MGKIAKAVMFFIYTVVVLIIGGYGGVFVNQQYERYVTAKENVAYEQHAEAVLRGADPAPSATKSSVSSAAAVWKIHQQCTAKGGIETKSGCSMP
jgi:hypothetical protein